MSARPVKGRQGPLSILCVETNLGTFRGKERRTMICAGDVSKQSYQYRPICLVSVSAISTDTLTILKFTVDYNDLETVRHSGTIMFPYVSKVDLLTLFTVSMETGILAWIWETIIYIYI